MMANKKTVLILILFGIIFFSFPWLNNNINYNLVKAEKAEETDYILLCEAVEKFLGVRVRNERGWWSDPSPFSKTDRTEANTLKNLFGTSPLNCKAPDATKISSILALMCKYPANEYPSNQKPIEYTCAYWKDPNEANEKTLSYVLGRAERIPGAARVITQAEFETDCEIGALDISLSSIITQPANYFLGTLLTIITGIIKTVLFLIISAFFWFLNPGNFGGFTTHPAVIVIWNNVRNLANLGIIIGMLIMAIGTILRIKEYNWDKILIKLILVALLINFSLIIAGIFVDISNFFTVYFLTAGGTERLGIIVDETISKVACAFSAQKAHFNFTMGTTMGLVLSSIFIFQFFGLLMYVVSRVVIIWVCLITSPLAFVASALPPLQKLWSTWRNYLTQAITVLPIISFVLWLVFIFLSIIAENLKATPETEFVAIIAYGILIIVLVQSVREVAKQLGVSQIEAGYQLARKTTMALAGAAAGHVGYQALRGAVSSESWRKTAEKLQKSDSGILYNLGGWMEKQPAAIRSKELKNIEESLKTKDETGIRHFMEIAARNNNRQQIAVGLNVLAGRGKLSLEKDNSSMQFAKDQPNLDVPAIKKGHTELFVENLDKDLDQKINDVLQSTPGIPYNQARERAVVARVTDIIKKASPAKIKEGGWEETMKRFENQGYLDQFFWPLLDVNFTPEAFAAIFSTLDSGVQAEWVEKFVESTRKKIRGTRTDALNHLKSRNFHKNRYFGQVLNFP